MSKAPEQIATTIPRISKDEDGVISIHWQRGQDGLLVLVTDDGAWCCSVKRNGSYYGTSHIEFDPANGWPDDAREILERMA